MPQQVHVPEHIEPKLTIQIDIWRSIRLVTYVSFSQLDNDICSSELQVIESTIHPPKGESIILRAFLKKFRIKYRIRIAKRDNMI